jgi:branched-chain amino acid aminotransferase
MADLPGCVYIDGEYVAPREARLSVFDAGLISGHMVFDVMAGWRGWIFKLDAHLDRFYRSSHSARIEIPHSREEFRELIIETYRRSGLEDSFIECIITRGDYMPEPTYRWRPTVVIFAVPYRWMIPPAKIETGARAIFARTRNIPMQCVDPKIKNNSRLHSYLALLEGVDVGVDEIIMLDLDGFVTEGRGANIFAVKDGRLYTPGEGILRGITREAVLEIAQDEGIPASIAALTPYDFYTADEAFFASTAGGVMPVIEIDRRQVGAGRPGDLTSLIKKVYWKRHVSSPWATPALTAAGATRGT